ncbi:MAG: AAA family ATPase [Candidatus Omnitrophica bacterium]|nr:AAA family ATPase [Candidatus Omnitrophota bacterium]
MYLEHWGLKGLPFENTPDPRFLYASRQHAEALARLRYVIEGRKGAGVLSGVFGCGKTLIGRALARLFVLPRYQVSSVTQPPQSAVELLRTIARSLGAPRLPERLTEMSTDAFLQAIEEILLNNAKDNRDTVVIIDEAHVLQEEATIDALRLLLNFQQEDRYLVTLILLGQPELRERLQRHKPFLQRIAMGYDLAPLERADTQQYITHRLTTAGAANAAAIFSELAVEAVHQNAGGIPRRINQLCDLALVSGWQRSVAQIDQGIVQEALAGLGV